MRVGRRERETSFWPATTEQQGGQVGCFTADFGQQAGRFGSCGTRRESVPQKNALTAHFFKSCCGGWLHLNLGGLIQLFRSDGNPSSHAQYGQQGKGGGGKKKRVNETSLSCVCVCVEILPLTTHDAYAMSCLYPPPLSPLGECKQILGKTWCTASQPLLLSNEPGFSKGLPAYHFMHAFSRLFKVKIFDLANFFLKKRHVDFNKSKMNVICYKCACLRNFYF